MNYQEHKQLIQENVIPHMCGKLFVSDHSICMSEYDTVKVLYSLKKGLPNGNNFLYDELRSQYIEQLAERYANKEDQFDVSLMPYARKHGLVKQLRKMIVR